MKHPLGMPQVFSDPEIHGGQPVLESGIPIYLILDMLAQGFSRETMRREYGLTSEQVRIALRFAADYLKHEGSHAASLALPPR
jgi:uncharacterized protein (DUF433 family)